MKEKNDVPNPHVGGCQAERIMKLLAKEWAVHIIWCLCNKGTMRFGTLKRTISGGISSRLLSLRLKEMEDAGIIDKNIIEVKNLHVEYRITELGMKIDRDLINLENII